MFVLLIYNGFFSEVFKCLEKWNIIYKVYIVLLCVFLGIEIFIDKVLFWLDVNISLIFLLRFVGCYMIIL